MSHDHAHGAGSGGHHHVGAHGDGASQRKLGVVTAINLVGFVVEFVGGAVLGSVALMGDAVHMLFDALAYATAFTAAYIAESRDGSDRFTYGLHRLEVLAALINGVLLVPMAGFIIWEAYQRFVAPVQIDVVPALGIAIGGLIVNVVSVLYLQREGAHSLNERGALYHLLGDAAGSVAVIIGLIVVAVTGITTVDVVAAVAIAALVIVSAGRIVLEGAGIMLQRSPYDPGDIEAVVREVGGVTDVHSLRAWQVCSSVDVCTIHVAMDVATLQEADAVRQRINRALADRFGIEHVTVQIEAAGDDS